MMSVKDCNAFILGAGLISAEEYQSNEDNERIYVIYVS